MSPKGEPQGRALTESPEGSSEGGGSTDPKQTKVTKRQGDSMMTLMMRRWVLVAVGCCVGGIASPPANAQGELEDGFRRLFNGDDLQGWVVPEGDGGHWKVVDGVIDYDAGSEASGDKNLHTEESFGDFILKMDWRIKETSGLYDMPIVLSDGSYLKDAEGKRITLRIPNADSGVYLRGHSRAQLNIWCWSTGSGELYGYRNNPNTPAKLRAAVTPRINADNPVGEWNRFVVVLVDDRLTVLLNEHLIIENAELPDLPERGPIVLQHHGGPRGDGTMSPASSLVQFKNLWIKPLD